MDYQVLILEPHTRTAHGRQEAWRRCRQQLGVGLAAAVLIDATIVRAVLLPSMMKLLGEWNWYLPRRPARVPALRLGQTARPT